MCVLGRVVKEWMLCLVHLSLSAQSDGETEEQVSVPIGIDDLESTPTPLPEPNIGSLLAPQIPLLPPTLSGKVSSVLRCWKVSPSVSCTLKSRVNGNLCRLF